MLAKTWCKTLSTFSKVARVARIPTFRLMSTSRTPPGVPVEINFAQTFLNLLDKDEKFRGQIVERLQTRMSHLETNPGYPLSPTTFTHLIDEDDDPITTFTNVDKTHHMMRIRVRMNEHSCACCVVFSSNEKGENSLLELKKFLEENGAAIKILQFSETKVLMAKEKSVKLMWSLISSNNLFTIAGKRELDRLSPTIDTYQYPPALFTYFELPRGEKRKDARFVNMDAKQPIESFIVEFDGEVNFMSMFVKLDAASKMIDLFKANGIDVLMMENDDLPLLKVHRKHQAKIALKLVCENNQFTLSAKRMLKIIQETNK